MDFLVKEVFNDKKKSDSALQHQRTIMNSPILKLCKKGSSDYDSLDQNNLALSAEE